MKIKLLFGQKFGSINATKIPLNTFASLAKYNQLLFGFLYNVPLIWIFIPLHFFFSFFSPQICACNFGEMCAVVGGESTEHILVSILSISQTKCFMSLLVSHQDMSEIYLLGIMFYHNTSRQDSIKQLWFVWSRWLKYSKLVEDL